MLFSADFVGCYIFREYIFILEIRSPECVYGCFFSAEDRDLQRQSTASCKHAISLASGRRVQKLVE